MPLHHGNTIEKVIRREGHSLTDVARLARVNRRSVYNWFMKPKLKPDIIHRIGRVIDHDFSIEFPDLFSSEDFKTKRKAEPAVTPDVEEFDIWREKYLDLLERYNMLLEYEERKHQISEAHV
jgi:lambda repressor-like predicted transcriptional regulator